MDDVSKYAHSPAHVAVARRDHAALRRLVASLPRLPRAGEVATEEESIAGEGVADAVSAVIDRRDVPRRETPLHLAVRLRDPVAADILMSAGADWSLQNAEGWSALQEAVCTREEAIATIIARHYQPLAWAKWCRRLPRILASISRIRDFYMEISFHFESSVIPFIGRIAPSDTYRIWKRGAALRAESHPFAFAHARAAGDRSSQPTNPSARESVMARQRRRRRADLAVAALALVALASVASAVAGADGGAEFDYRKLSGIIIPGFASTQLRAWSVLDCPYSPFDFNPLDSVWLDTAKLFSAVNCWLKCMLLEPYNQTDHPECKSRPDSGLSAITELDPGYITGFRSSLFSMERMGQMVCRVWH